MNLINRDARDHNEISDIFYMGAVIGIFFIIWFGNKYKVLD